MATSKTIIPTNQTVSIPALADVPDISVVSDALDKTIDAINTLDTHTAMKYDSTHTPTELYESAPVGFSVVRVTAGKTGNPTATGDWNIMQFKPDNYNDYGVQIACQTNSAQLWLRRLYAGTWTAWIEYATATQLNKKMTGSVQDFYQSNVAHTITFDGSASSRAFAGFIAICGQSGIAEYVPFGLIGSNISVKGTITAVAVASNSLNITTSGKVVSIPASIQGGWGTISVVMFRDEPDLTITFA